MMTAAMSRRAQELAARGEAFVTATVVRAAESGWRVRSVDVPYADRTGRSKVTGTPLGVLQTVRDMSAVLAR